MLGMTTRVAVVGTGAAGLAALRHLLAHQGSIQATAFEQTGQVGGTWVYTERTGQDVHRQPVHSSMYANLRTNLPKEVMAFPDFPFDKDLPSFITHDEVKTYLEAYAEHFHLLPHIQLHRKVASIQPSCKNNHMTWTVTAHDVKDLSVPPQVHQFDAVIVCNGHFSVPLMPEFPGLDTFRGSVMHSHDYRHPEDYQGKRVIVLGANSSGQDIALDLAPFAKEVILCHRKSRLASPLPGNIRQELGISSVSADGVTLDDGSTVTEVDALLFCTGYKYIFPFLARECHPDIVDERVPLYKHIFNPRYPTLTFIGIPKVVCPFPQFHCQVMLILSVLLGDKKLPSAEEMEEDMEKDFQERLSRGMARRHAHHMGPLQWGYNEELARLGGFDPIPRVVRTLYDGVHAERRIKLTTYKTQNYVLLDDETYKEVLE